MIFILFGWSSALVWEESEALEVSSVVSPLRLILFFCRKLTKRFGHINVNVLLPNRRYGTGRGIKLRGASCPVKYSLTCTFVSELLVSCTLEPTRRRYLSNVTCENVITGSYEG